jgi:hypothetical protein
VLTGTFDIAVTQLTPAGRRAIGAIIGSRHVAITSIVLPGPLNRPDYSSGGRESQRARGSGGSSQVRTGVLTGTAADCDSGVNGAAAARSQVMVEATTTSTENRFGANERIIDGHAFRFVLPAGRCQLIDSWLDEQLYLGRSITVRRGRVTHADLVSEICPP